MEVNSSILETLPYRPEGLIAEVPVPETVKRPEAIQEMVRMAKYTYNSSPNTLHKLPAEYTELEAFFAAQYERAYKERVGIDIVPYHMDVLFQQYAVKRDEELDRTGFNTFGLFAPSYLEGLSSSSDTFDRYFGAYEEPRDRKQYKTLLLGCSSIPSAKEFTSFVKAVNPKATAIIADIDSLAVQLAKESDALVVQADAQRIPLEDESVDFVATNFLLISLVDQLGSGEESAITLMKEVNRILKPGGRVVMVEQFPTIDLEDFSYRVITEAELHYAHRSRNGRKTALIARHSQFGQLIQRIPAYIESQRYKAMHSYPGSTSFKRGERTDIIESLGVAESPRVRSLFLEKPPIASSYFHP